jgi:hypothetical protein
MKTYELFTTGPGGEITNSVVTASRWPPCWRATVKAESIRYAYSRLARQVESQEHGNAGVVSLDHNNGPSAAGWPWRMQRPYPKYWRREQRARGERLVGQADGPSTA